MSESRLEKILAEVKGIKQELAVIEKVLASVFPWKKCR